MRALRQQGTLERQGQNRGTSTQLLICGSGPHTQVTAVQSMDTQTVLCAWGRAYSQPRALSRASWAWRASLS